MRAHSLASGIYVEASDHRAIRGSHGVITHEIRIGAQLHESDGVRVTADGRR